MHHNYKFAIPTHIFLNKRNKNVILSIPISWTCLICKDRAPDVHKFNPCIYDELNYNDTFTSYVSILSNITN